MNPATMYLHSRTDDRLAADTGERRTGMDRHTGLPVAMMQVQLPGPDRQRRWWRIVDAEPYPGYGWHWGPLGTVQHESVPDPYRRKVVAPHTHHSRQADALAVFMDAVHVHQYRPTLVNISRLKLAGLAVLGTDKACQFVPDTIRRTREVERLELEGFAEDFAEKPSQARLAAVLRSAAALVNESHNVDHAQRKVARSTF